MKLAIRSPLTHRTEVVLGITGLTLLAATWCLLTYGGFIGKLFLPTPTRLWEGLVDFHRKGWLWLSLWRSFIRVTKGLGLVLLIGIPIGLLMGAFKPLDALLEKIISGAKSVPTTAITGIVVLWFGIEETGKIVFLFLGAIFFMIILARNAVAAVSDDYVRVALDLGANRSQMILQVLLPGALPRIWDAVIICNGIMWTYIVLAEFINSSEKQLGIGYLLQTSSHAQEAGKTFAALLVIALISALTDHGLQMIRRRFFDW